MLDNLFQLSIALHLGLSQNNLDGLLLSKCRAYLTILVIITITKSSMVSFFIFSCSMVPSEELSSLVDFSFSPEGVVIGFTSLIINIDNNF